MISILKELIKKEEARQSSQWNLIASENYAYREVIDLSSNVLNNKYVEGVIGRRFYSGCSIVDEVEQLACYEAQKLFQSEYVNVAPHCGAVANLIAYFALLEKGDTVLAMDLASGGHITHGYKKNITSSLYNFIFYGLSLQTQLIDYDDIEDKIKKYRPKLVISGASAYSRLIDYKKIYTITQKYGALHLVDMAHIAGLVAAKVIPSPVAYADIITLTTHKTLRGPRGGMILAKKEFSQKIERAVLPGVQGGQFMSSIAAKAWICHYAQTKDFYACQMKVLDNMRAMVSVFKEYDISVVSGGSDNHLCILDLSKYDKTGKEIAEVLEKNGIIVNQNLIPFDKKSPLLTSGIRLGTPFMTALGKNKDDFISVAQFISKIVVS